MDNPLSPTKYVQAIQLAKHMQREFIRGNLSEVSSCLDYLNRGRGQHVDDFRAAVISALITDATVRVLHIEGDAHKAIEQIDREQQVIELEHRFEQGSTDG